MLIEPKESSHWYTSTGQPRYDADLRTARKENLWPSVTTVLKAWPDKGVLDKWKIEQAMIALQGLDAPDLTPENARQLAYERSMDRTRDAATFGRRIHAACEAYAKNKCHDYVIESDILPHFEGFKQWYDANVKEVVFAEKALTNSLLCYAGMADLCFVSMHGGIVLADIKTQGVRRTPNFYHTWAMQLAAYRYCDGISAQQVMSIVIDSATPSYPAIKSWADDEADDAWEDFQSCYSVWKRWKGYYPTNEPLMAA